MPVHCNPPIEAPAPASGLRVIVTDDDGLEVPGARVVVGGPCLLPRQGVTDEHGIVRFTDLDAQPVEITVERYGFDPRRYTAELGSGRTVVLNVELRLSSEGAWILDPPPLLPRLGRRGGTLDATIPLLPWAGLGGARGLLEHPALGAGPATAPVVLGAAVPVEVLGAVPQGLLDGLDARSVSLVAGDHAAADLWTERLGSTRAGITVAGDAEGALGVSSTVSGGLSGKKVGLHGSVEQGLLGQSAGLSAQVRTGYNSWLQSALLRSDEAWLAGLHGWSQPNPRLGVGYTAAASGAGEEVEGRVALNGRFDLPRSLSRILAARLEAVGGSAGGAALISASDAWQRWNSTVYSSARVRLDGQQGPRLEGQIGASRGVRRLDTFALLGQRHEGLEALDDGGVRSREVLVGVARELRRLDVAVTGLGALRQDTVTGQELPGRADLRLQGEGHLWRLVGQGGLTWRPPLSELNTDLPELEGGLLLALPARGSGPIQPTGGLGLSAARWDGQLTASGAARLGAQREGDGVIGELGLEGQGDLDGLDAVWLRLTISAFP